MDNNIPNDLANAVTDVKFQLDSLMTVFDRGMSPEAIAHVMNEVDERVAELRSIVDKIS